MNGPCEEWAWSLWQCWCAMPSFESDPCRGAGATNNRQISSHMQHLSHLHLSDIEPDELEMKLD